MRKAIKIFLILIIVVIILVGGNSFKRSDGLTLYSMNITPDEETVRSQKFGVGSSPMTNDY